MPGCSSNRRTSCGVIARGTYLSTFGEAMPAAASARIRPSPERKWQKDLIAAVFLATVDEA